MTITTRISHFLSFDPGIDSGKKNAISHTISSYTVIYSITNQPSVQTQTVDREGRMIEVGTGGEMRPRLYNQINAVRLGIVKRDYGKKHK